MKSNDNVSNTHPEYNNNTDIWEKCRDAVAGQKAIKVKNKQYLPKPFGMDESDYLGYLQRAQFFNATSRTVSGILGQLFRKEPVIETTNNDYLENITLDGKSFETYAKDVAKENGVVGRVGTIVDVDSTGQPYIAMYKTESIINWKESFISGKNQLSLVVLKESYELADQDFSHETGCQYRVLRLIEGVYIQQVWRESQDKAAAQYELVDEITPLMDGAALGFIPFYILNSYGVGNSVDTPVINDLVDINIGHYNNSADYENDLHWSGIKTVVVPGWTTTDPVPLGKALVVDAESKPFILESNGSSILADELKQKEERMSVLGSQILANRGRYIQSSETSQINDKGEVGILSAMSADLDDYFYLILSVCYAWGKWGEVNTVAFNKDFEPGNLNIDNLIKVFGLISSGMIPEQVGFEMLKKYELIEKTMTIEEFRNEIKKNSYGSDIDIDIEEDVE